MMSVINNIPETIKCHYERFTRDHENDDEYINDVGKAMHNEALDIIIEACKEKHNYLWLDFINKCTEEELIACADFQSDVNRARIMKAGFGVSDFQSDEYRGRISKASFGGEVHARQGLQCCNVQVEQINIARSSEGDNDNDVDECDDFINLRGRKIKRKAQEKQIYPLKVNWNNALKN